jgi:hypothetical protein
MHATRETRAKTKPPPASEDTDGGFMLLPLQRGSNANLTASFQRSAEFFRSVEIGSRLPGRGTVVPPATIGHVSR